MSDLPHELMDYDTCEKHEITFLRCEGCPWCMQDRIKELEATLQRVGELPKYDIAQNILEGKTPTPTDSIVKGLWVNNDELQAELKKK